MKKLVWSETVVEGGRPGDVAHDLGVSVNAVYLSKSRVARRLVHHR